MKALIGKLGGRKFLLALVTAVVIALSSLIGLDLPVEKVASIAAVVVGFIVAQGYADGKTDGKTSTTAQVDPENTDAEG